MTLSSADNLCKQFGSRSGRYSVKALSGSRLFDTLKVLQAEVEPIYFNNALNIYMTLSSADNSLQTVWTQIRTDILSRPYRGPDCLTL